MDTSDLAGLSRDELERRKLAADARKTELDCRELERPQHRRLPTLISCVTALAAVVGVAVQYVLSEKKYQLSQIKAAQAELDADKAEQRVQEANSIEEATRKEVEQRQLQLEAVQAALDQAKESLKRVAGSPDRSAEVESALQAVDTAQEAIPKPAQGDEVALARELERLVRSDEYARAAALFEQLERAYSAVTGTPPTRTRPTPLINSGTKSRRCSH